LTTSGASRPTRCPEFAHDARDDAVHAIASIGTLHCGNACTRAHADEPQEEVDLGERGDVPLRPPRLERCSIATVGDSEDRIDVAAPPTARLAAYALRIQDSDAGLR